MYLTSHNNTAKLWFTRVSSRAILIWFGLLPVPTRITWLTHRHPQKYWHGADRCICQPVSCNATLGFSSVSSRLKPEVTVSISDDPTKTENLTGSSKTSVKYICFGVMQPSYQKHCKEITQSLKRSIHWLSELSWELLNPKQMTSIPMSPNLPSRPKENGHIDLQLERIKWLGPCY